MIGEPRSDAMIALTKPEWTLDAFIAWENEQPEKHEFHRGEVFAMVGGWRAHGRVIANLTRHIGNQLSGSPCQAFAEGMKLQIGDDTITYPDLFVTCDRADLRTEQIFRAPTLIVEVLSPSTQAYDRGRKFAFYRRLASLQEYILVDPDSKRVEAFRRDPDGRWYLHDQSEGGQLEAASVGVRMSHAEVFDGVDVAPDA
jgi:Uma2 family endonuclease